MSCTKIYQKKLTDENNCVNEIGIYLVCRALVKGGFKSEDTGEFLLLQKNIPNHYPEQKI